MNPLEAPVDDGVDLQHQQFAWQALTTHFGGMLPEHLASSRRQFPHHTRPELQRALLRLLAPFAPRLLGLNQDHPTIPLKFPSLFKRGAGAFSHAISLAPVQSQEVEVGDEEIVAVFDNALWLVTDGGQLKAAVLFEQHIQTRVRQVASVEIVHLPSAAGNDFARRAFAELEQAVRDSSLYRGKVLSLEDSEAYSGKPGGLMVHRLPPVAREDLILPAATMKLLERNIFDFAHSRGALKALHQSLQKGILLYGPPGTGKTHTIRYLASNLPGHTTLLISADQVTQLDRYMSLARLLQPCMVVIEDVDLVGRDREEMRGPKEESLLNRLLNEMDGLQPDAEILFVLTTNRPEAIEGALSARPGRIDQAIEIALPDAECRARLLRLYGARMRVPGEVIDHAVSRTEGVSSAFVKELVRRLAQESIVRGTPGEVRMADLESVLHDMLQPGNELSQALLGARPRQAPREVRHVGNPCF
ncbi:AAA family ATPase [Burkholderia sp. Cy-637]|uniref:AAA family ATPase n=1 Tax=Burkholderia sp. Cy-637 TaxID=2608327 RepID=UPI001420BC2D|nr:AAA family ATPase [Burkholderia sp. Cy-637]NIF89825.1 AAA family ATPase [Burkholderia sp. Cy-637]